MVTPSILFANYRAVPEDPIRDSATVSSAGGGGRTLALISSYSLPAADWSRMELSQSDPARVCSESEEFDLSLIL